MRTQAAIVVVIVAAASVWARSSSGQVQAVPGPGTGVVNVRGAVDIANVPVVEAVQRGEWRVAVTNPSVVLAPHPFLRLGGRYDVTWPVGEKETIVVGQTGPGGWVRVDTPGKHRWINLDLTKSIEELP
jgi:hypothetical protein